jgi:hypothetical protein
VARIAAAGRVAPVVALRPSAAPIADLPMAGEAA